MTSADLNIDFGLNPMINLITQLLYNSITDSKGKPPPIQFVWDLPVNLRIKCIIYISLISMEEPFEIKLRCKNNLCLEQFGFFLTQQFINIVFSNDPEKEFVEIEFQKSRLKFRIPTGTDQLNWLQKSYKSKFELQNDIIFSLIAENLTNNEKKKFHPSLHRFKRW